jgi:hypothetical protein
MSRRSQASRRFAHAIAISLLMAFAVGSLAACGTTSRLQPAPGARIEPGNRHAAVAEAANVRMTVEAGAWVGSPLSLDQTVTPLRVTMENHNRYPVRVSYGDFTLTADRGFTGAAIPPYRIAGSVTSTVTALEPRFAYDRFSLAPSYWGYYPSMRRWRYAWAYDPFYYDRYYPYWQTTALPSDDMLQQALPEGVLEPGGRVTGFLFFQPLDQDSRGATFRATLVDPQSGRTVGRLRVPFIAR